ncbi:MAG: pyridoxal kinase PdxY [Rhodospirillales bacterium]|nr:pyridoxal kinase PdxY [Rhodospirillales bacterium]
MTILSFQSRVSYGCVGHGAAEFTLRRIGLDVCPIDTVRLSNHPGYGHSRGGAVAGADIAELVAGLEEIGVLARFTAVLSGYLGTAAAGEAALAAAAKVRAASAGAPYCCDPVMGDRATGLYVPADLVAFFRDRAVRGADIVVPNHFELEVLAGRVLPSLADAVAAAVWLRGQGPRLVCVSSLKVAELGDRLGTLVLDGSGAWLVQTPHLDIDAKGAGDVLSALLLAHLLAHTPPAEALVRAVASTFAIVEATFSAGERELALVAAQDALVAPPRLFAAEALTAAG